MPAPHKLHGTCSEPGREEGYRANTRTGGHTSKDTKDCGSFQIQHNSKRKITGRTKSDHKLIQEVDTHWNGTYAMLERLFAQKEPVGAALVTLKTNLTPLTSEEDQTVNESIGVMCHFNEASIELSEEKIVSGSKVIPLMRMLRHVITSKTSCVHYETALLLCNNRLRLLSERMSTYETMSNSARSML